jgi:hypothetical protein
MLFTTIEEHETAEINGGIQVRPAGVVDSAMICHVTMVTAMYCSVRQGI